VHEYILVTLLQDTLSIALNGTDRLIINKNRTSGTLYFHVLRQISWLLLKKC